MHSFKRPLLIILFIAPVISFSQGMMADSTHGFSKLISNLYMTRNAHDELGYGKLIHPYYENKGMIVSHDDSTAIRWGFDISSFPRIRIYDTVTVQGDQFCKVEYSLNCVKSISKDQMDLVPHLDRIFGASPALKQDGYFNKSDSTYKHYPKRYALMVLKNGESTWRILPYNPKDIESSFRIEPREVFYAIEGFNGAECQSTNFTQEQLGKLVYQSMVNGHLRSLYCYTGIQRTELMWCLTKEKQHLTENKLYENLIYKKKTIDQDAARLYREYPWKETKFSQVYSYVEKVNDMSFSAILVEFIYKGQYVYFEVESVLTPAGWRIIDDINIDSFRTENEAFILKRKG